LKFLSTVTGNGRKRSEDLCHASRFLFFAFCILLKYLNWEFGVYYE